jgi:uncharacterized protein YbjT (DUF2867 family)
MEKKIIAVLGATGSQGGGMARAIFAGDQFACRAITRDITKPAAKALAAAGSEVAAADLDDVESLKAAFAGAHGVFAVTNFWEHMSPARELQQAANIAEAAKAAGISHVVWSTLEGTRDLPLDGDAQMPRLSEDGSRVPHFDAKNDANAHFTGLPVTFLITSYFWDNMINFGLGPKRQADGRYVWTMADWADAPIAGHATEDIGRAALGIFAAGKRFIGQTVGIQSAAPTLQEMADAIANEFDIEVEVQTVDFATYRGFGFPGSDDLGNNFEYFRIFNDRFMSIRSESLMRELNCQVEGFAEFLKRRHDDILAAMNG